jgi:SAM-dependent methyltransferase
MEEIRSYHNLVKRQLIQSATQPGSSALDVGCGFGGDLQKWAHAGVRTLDMCDPSAEALIEAKSRASKMKGVEPTFYHGDILACPTNKKYDVICYNFSLHYIFENYKLFKNSIRAIKDRLRPGGKLIGVIPDSESVLMGTPFHDPLGNFMIRKDDTGYGNFGEKLFVNLVDTPFYANGAKAEPIAYKDLLITELWEQGIELHSWQSLTGNPLSKMYSQFIFIRKD